MHAQSPGSGAAAVLAAGATWALLCALLAAAGHAPSFTVLPIPRETYYRVQAIAVVPILLGLWALCAAVASRVAHALGGSGDALRAAGPLGLALGGPLLGAFLLPDLVVYLTAGFAALAPLVRVTAPLSFALTLLAATFAVATSHGLPRGRAFVAAAAGVIAQAALGAVILR